MSFLGRLSLVMLLAAPQLGCEDRSECGDGASKCASAHELCAGSQLLRFAGTSAGGNLTGVPRVASEVGWSFLIVQDECRYWTMLEPDGPIHTGVLQYQRDFKDGLKLGRWTPEDSRPDGCADASTTTLRYGGDELSLACASTEISDAYQLWLETLHARGTPLDGDVRYSVSDASTDGWVVGNTTDIASPWTLDGDPSAELLEPGEDESAQPTIASGNDAEALRAAREDYASLESGVGPWLRTPMVLESASAEPRYLNVAMRDVTPFERDGKLSVDDFMLE